MNNIHVIGLGPGTEELLTPAARQALREADVIIGYTVYLDLLGEDLKGKELLSTPMRAEEERCRMCFEQAKQGKKVALICSGDAGIYGLASLMFEVGKEYPDCRITVIPGITAASAGAAVLGAPLNHDFCVISLSDLLTPWEKIEKRLLAAAQADMAIVLYNPASHKRPDHLKKACEILLTVLEPERPCGYVENIGREGEKYTLCSLNELKDAAVNMFTTVFIGNSTTEIIGDALVTKRGYPAENRKE